MSDTALTDSTEPSDLPCSTCVPDLGQVDVDDVAQFLLRVIGDPDGAGVAFHVDPLVFFGVTEVFWIHVYFARL